MSRYYDIRVDTYTKTATWVENDGPQPEPVPTPIPEPTPVPTPVPTPEPTPVPRAPMGMDELLEKGVHRDQRIVNLPFVRGVNVFDSRSCDAASHTADRAAVLQECKRRILYVKNILKATMVRFVVSTYKEQNERVTWDSITRDATYRAETFELIQFALDQGLYVVASCTWHPDIDMSVDEMGWCRVGTDYIESMAVLSREFGSHPMFAITTTNEPRWNIHRDRTEEYLDVTREAAQWLKANNAVTLGIPAPQNWARYGVEDMRPLVDEGLAQFIDVHPYNEVTGINPEVVLNDPGFQDWAMSDLPVVLSEFGPTQYMSAEAANNCMKLANHLQIPWAGWAFHHRCPPSMLVDNYWGDGIGDELELTLWGQAIKAGLAV